MGSTSDTSDLARQQACDHLPLADQSARAESEANERLSVLAVALFQDKPIKSERVTAEQSGGDSLSFAPDASEVNSKILDTAQAFGIAHRLDIRAENGQIYYSMAAGGEKLELFSTAASDTGLKDAKVELQRLTDLAQSSLEKRYGVTFAAEGEVIGYQRATAESKPSNHAVLARNPELFELYGVKSALEKSEPGNIGADGRPLKFYSLSENMVTEMNPVATFQSDKDGRGSVYIWPGASGIKYATEADLPNEESQLSYFDRARPMTLQYAVTHELGHNSSIKLGYERPSTVNEGSIELTASGGQMANELGWVKRSDAENTGQDWLILGKSLDDNGEQASYLPESNMFQQSWIRWRSEGGVVNKVGKIVPAQDGQRLSEAEMLAEAKVKPISWYYTDPSEMYAESISHFRLAASARANLNEASPELYQAVKQNDQKEIDLRYGSNADGSSKMTRLPNGSIAENSRSNQEVVRLFEENSDNRFAIGSLDTSRQF
ncbi:hypothetical protein BH11CYA1_BH11CYA1_04250 [soil metagenome]